MENTYLVNYLSKNNIFEGKVVISAKNLVEAQDKFFDWLKKQPVYQYMWNLSISIEEIKEGVI